MSVPISAPVYFPVLRTALGIARWCSYCWRPWDDRSGLGRIGSRGAWPVLPPEYKQREIEKKISEIYLNCFFPGNAKKMIINALPGPWQKPSLEAAELSAIDIDIPFTEFISLPGIILFGCVNFIARSQNCDTFFLVLVSTKHQLNGRRAMLIIGTLRSLILFGFCAMQESEKSFPLSPKKALNREAKASVSVACVSLALNLSTR